MTIDLKKRYRHLYAAGARPAVVDVPRLSFLAIDGTGDPSKDRYREAVEALYAVAYRLRFGLKKAGVLDHPVMPLEGLWSGAAPGEPTPQDRDSWRWTMMIMQPPQVTPELVAQAVADSAAKRPSDAVERLRLLDFTEGTSGQILHVGPYAEEDATLERLMSYLDDNGYRIAGRHHEVYLTNPERTASERLRTILRYPVQPP